MAHATLDSESFFGLVDELLSPAMLGLGFHRIGGSENDQPMSRAILTSSGQPPPPPEPSATPFLVYDFGFEAGSAEAQRLADPESPDSAEELWLSFEPGTGELDLSDWQHRAGGRVDWDLRSDTGPRDAQEVRHRLAALGRALADSGPDR